MSVSLIRSLRSAEDASNKPKVAGRIVTTITKAKELRPHIEKLITMAKKALVHDDAAEQFATSAERNSTEWKEWRKSDRWRQWAKAKSPAVALRRRAFAALRDKEALDILFSEIGPRFRDRQGGYTRIARLAEFRIGDAGRKAMIEFVGDRDRVKSRKRQAPVVRNDEPAPAAPTA